MFISELLPPDRGPVQDGPCLLAPLAPWSVDGLFANFVASDEPDQLSRCYDDETTSRLRSLADHYDPDRVLLQ